MGHLINPRARPDLMPALYAADDLRTNRDTMGGPPEPHSSLR
jgi:hypothetical protein